MQKHFLAHFLQSCVARSICCKIWNDHSFLKTNDCDLKKYFWKVIITYSKFFRNLLTWYRSEESCNVWSWSKLLDFILPFYELRELFKIGCYICPWYVNWELKTWAVVEDHRISHREYFPTVMVNVSQCLLIDNYLAAPHVHLDKEIDINKNNI